MELRRRPDLDLSLKGSVGSFNVGSGRESQNSIEVKYFLTHVGLDFAKRGNEALLSHIAPVREVFDFEKLSFDQIMQRDLDDARVSSDLIPYLLDEQSTDLVKLFPPIVVVVLPVEQDANQPADLYPKVETKTEEVDGRLCKVVRAGKVGREAFQFAQPLLDDEPLEHDFVQLQLNTYRTRLVIVDGQHRAMALLALYRNLKEQWSDEKRAPYEEYYAEWTPRYIRQFNLAEIELPVMLCTFPQLCEGYGGDFDVTRAARLIFLTLNKNARKVSDSRNKLLNDSDLIADFLRRCLAEVKVKDARSPFSLRIHNVELDQAKDRVKLYDPIAITGVNHLYYIVEQLMLSKGNDVSGMKQRGGNFALRTDLTDNGLLQRLDGRDRIGDKAADATTRTLYTNDVAEKLGVQFDARYGEYVVDALEQFAPFECHNQAALDLQSKLAKQSNRKVTSILFEGQGIGRVFNRHRENLEKKLKEDGYGSQVPEIRSTLRSLNDTNAQKEAALEQFRKDRAGYYLSDLHDKHRARADDGAWHSFFVKQLDKLYDDVFTTVAFQSAFVCGFFGEWEHAQYLRRFNNEDEAGETEKKSAFKSYLEQVNRFFKPQSFAELKRILRVFRGPVEPAGSEWNKLPSGNTFGDVVKRGAMKPDKWPNYKYLLLEVWEPEDERLADAATQTKKLSREQVLKRLYDKRTKNYCEEHTKLPENLNPDERRHIFDSTCETYADFLKNVEADVPSKADFQRMNEDLITFEEKAD